MERGGGRPQGSPATIVLENNDRLDVIEGVDTVVAGLREDHWPTFHDVETNVPVTVNRAAIAYVIPTKSA
jgi:hypothetical protein